MSNGKSTKPKKVIFAEAIKTYVVSKLANKYSPEPIAGKAKNWACLVFRMSAFISLFGQTKNKEANCIKTCGHKEKDTENAVLIRINNELNNRPRKRLNYKFIIYI